MMSENFVIRCLNGRKIVFYRRKPDSTCFVPDDFNMSKVLGICECTGVDWECDAGFERKGPVCSPNAEISDTFDQPPANCQDFYEIPTGYIKARDSYCQGGLNYPVITTNCTRRNMQMYTLLTKNNLYRRICSTPSHYTIYCEDKALLTGDGRKWKEGILVGNDSSKADEIPL